MPKKHDYEYIKSIIERRDGCELASKIYKNARTKLEIKCPSNHIFHMTFDNFIKGHDCKQCSDTKRRKPFLTYSDVKQYIEIDSKSNCLLLSDDYTGVTQKMKLRCECGDTFITDFHNFQMGKIKCNRCNGITNWTYPMVKKYLEENGYKLISEEYHKAVEKLELECSKGHFCQLSINDIQQGVGCAQCAGNKRYSIDEVKEIVEQEHGYKLISEEYVNLTTILLIKCDKGHIYESNLASFKFGCRCKICNMSSGEKNIKNWLNENNIEFTTQYRFIDCKYKNTLPFDFAIFYKNDLICLIEYDGIQHFEPVDHFGGDRNFEITKIRDEIKNEYCRRNNIPLIRIPYWEKDNIKNILDNKLIK
ncbi:hypothetical protein [Heyndrickxia camelliae]|uniref:DUF2726 domain-containing protein n=1 Tax=Heyndrickxia camelliae TaxID=1707093 RepID=A0A2N3LE09_9BACI|nr:hypothetical protein [Heyndrickxia camelliae]PKR82858.1 hypothetical protein CWO92_21955 [Heyndrickxia camelliae]